MGAFVMDMSQAQLLPAAGSPLALKYGYCDALLTVLFTTELLINLFSRSADYFREFVSKWANWFLFFSASFFFADYFREFVSKWANWLVKYLRSWHLRELLTLLFRGVLITSESS